MTKLSLTIRCPNGSKYQVETNSEDTVGDFKKAIEKVADIPAAEQRVIYKGRVLKDDATVESYGSSYFMHRILSEKCLYPPLFSFFSVHIYLFLSISFFFFLW